MVASGMVGASGGRKAVPWIVGAVAMGALAVEAPLVAAGVGAVVFLLVVPWEFVFTLLVAASIAQGVSSEIAGVTVRPEMLLAVVFALRAFTLRERADLGRTEWLLLAFVGVLVGSSLLYAPDPAASLRGAATTGFGTLAFLGTVVALRDEARLQRAVRVFLGMTAAGAVLGLAFLAAHWLVGSSFGITLLHTLPGVPSITGLAYEHDLFGSTCAAIAVVFLVLWHEPDRLLSPAMCAAGFWICAAGAALSLARGAWLGFAVGVVVAVLLRGRAIRALLGLAGVGALIVGLVAVYVLAFSPVGFGDAGEETTTALGQQAVRVLDLGSTTGAQRVAEWKVAAAEFAGSPWFGLGAWSFGQRHVIVTPGGLVPAFLGNWVVRTAHDAGLVGLLLFLAFAMSVGWPSRRVRAAIGSEGALARALVCGCVVLAVAYLATDGTPFVWPWILFGLTRAARRAAAVPGEVEPAGGTSALAQQV